jgi:hypothetical protein
MHIFDFDWSFARELDAQSAWHVKRNALQSTACKSQPIIRFAWTLG